MTKNYVTNFDNIKPIASAMVEQETSVSFYRTEDTMRIYTSDNTTLTILKKKVAANPKEWKCWIAHYTPDGEPTGYFFEAPRSICPSAPKQKNTQTKSVRRSESDLAKPEIRESEMKLTAMFWMKIRNGSNMR